MRLVVLPSASADGAGSDAAVDSGTGVGSSAAVGGAAAVGSGTLNAHVDYTGEKLSAEKQAVVSLAPAKPATKDDVLPSFSLLGKEREAGRVRDKAPSPTTVYNNPWCVLCDEEDGASRKGKTKKNSEVRPVTVPPLAGVWADEVRKIAVMQK